MKKVVRKVSMGVEYDRQQYQLFFEDNTFIYAWWDLKKKRWEGSVVSGTLDEPIIADTSQPGPTAPAGENFPPVPEGKTVDRRVMMETTGNGIQRWQIIYTDKTSDYFFLNTRDNTWSTINPDTGESAQPTGPTPPGGSTGPTSPTSPTGPRTETRRVSMGVSNGIQQWQIFYSDGTFEYKWLNLNNNTWTDFDPNLYGPSGPTPPGGSTGPTGGAGENWPPVPEGKTVKERIMMDTSGSGIQRWQVIYTDGTFEYFFLNLNDKTWSTINPDTGEPVPPGGEVPPEEEEEDGGGGGGSTPPPPGPTGPTMAYDVFRDIMISLLGITDDALLKDIYNASGRYIADGVNAYMIPDLLAGSPDAPESFKLFIGGFNKIKALDIGITTIAEFTRARNDYKSLMRYYGLDEYVSDEAADQFMTNAVSVNEASARMEAAFNAIKYADEALKEQLKTYFPSLTDKDIAASILGVGETVAELQKKIGVSGIRAEAATTGVTGKLSAEELFAQGVSRERARQGYQDVKTLTPLAEAAAARARQAPGDMQEELEKEALLGLRSQRRAKLAAREQAYFAGKSGTANISLGESATGQF